MDLFEAIRERRSVREYQDKEIPKEDIEKILEAGRWAPSGRNTQPWKFIVVTDDRTKEKLERTVPQGLIKNAPVTLAIMKDKTRGYEELKDAQGIGACAQNILLAAHGLGIGTCWIGLTRNSKAEEILEAERSEELMMLITMGYPTEGTRSSSRIELEKITKYM